METNIKEIPLNFLTLDLHEIMLPVLINIVSKSFYCIVSYYLVFVKYLSLFRCFVV